jgi:hypothetical protein
MAGKICGACSTHGREAKMPIKCWLSRLEGIDNLEELREDVKMLERILEKVCE